MKTSIHRIVAAVAVMFVAVSCQNTGEESEGGDRISSGERNSLYQRMGGESVLKKVIDDTVERAQVDPNINWSRPGAPQGWKPTQENFDDFKEGLTRYVSEQIGGPKRYEGQDMRTVHEGMRITSAEFDAFMNHVRAALANHNVPAKEQQELVRVFEKTRNQIVEQPRRQSGQ